MGVRRVLCRSRLGHVNYWQFWRNSKYGDVGRFLRLFTDLPEDEIARLEKLGGAEINEAKKLLAFEATKLCRGEAAAAEAAETARQTFEEGVTATRSEEHTSELQSLMRTSYAVFCLKKKNKSDASIH